MVDPEGNVAEPSAQSAPYVAEQLWPFLLVRHHDDCLAHTFKPATGRRP